MKKLAKASCRRALLQGTLDLLILQTLTHGPAHGQMLAFKIFHDSKQAIRVSSGSLYPALYRLERQGDITSSRGVSGKYRWARFYRLTLAGRRELVSQLGGWARICQSIELVIRDK